MCRYPNGGIMAIVTSITSMTRSVIKLNISVLLIILSLFLQEETG